MSGWLLLQSEGGSQRGSNGRVGTGSCRLQNVPKAEQSDKNIVETNVPASTHTPSQIDIRFTKTPPHPCNLHKHRNNYSIAESHLTRTFNVSMSILLTRAPAACLPDIS